MFYYACSGGRISVSDFRLCEAIRAARLSWSARAGPVSGHTGHRSAVEDTHRREPEPVRGGGADAAQQLSRYER